MKAVMYHYVRPADAEYPYLKYLNLDDFRRQLDYFSEEFGFVSQTDFFQGLETGISPEGVVLTFDDGFRDHFEYVFPELLCRGLWGIFYVPTLPLTSDVMLDTHNIHLLTGKIPGVDILRYLEAIVSEDMLVDKGNYKFSSNTYKNQVNEEYVTYIKRVLNYYISYEFRQKIIEKLINNFFDPKPTAHRFYLTQEEIKAMADCGMIIGSHGVNHYVMSKLELASQRYEIEDSINFLAAITGKVTTFCYPYGGFHSFTHETMTLLEKAKINFAFNVESRDVTALDLLECRMALPRYDCNQFPFGKCRV
jgi:peptidoglycan/xylan/chitin deacetylase (PgdA/CDA1 family)